MATDAPLGTVRRDGGQWVLRYERRLAHPVEKVWRAITESEHLRHWLPCDLVGERHQGATLVLPFWPAHVERYGIEDPVLHGEIRVWQPPSVFEWTWDTDVLRWELEPDADGTVLTLTATVAGGTDGGPAGTAAGYHVCLVNLVELLDSGTAPPLVDADVATWNQAYEHVIAAGTP
jgi:uncharacterized protein YndB with AHSA1/START domain